MAFCLALAQFFVKSLMLSTSLMNGDQLIFIGIFALPFILQFLIALALVLAALYLALKNFRNSNHTRAWIWLLLAAAPFAYHFGSQSSANVEIENRDKYVANLVRKQLDDNYPRTLEIHGYLNDTHVAALLNSGAFDTILQFQTPKLQQKYIATKSSDCQRRGRHHLNLAITRTWRLDGKAKSCVLFSQSRVDPRAARPDAILLLMDQNATLRISGNSWAGGAVEIRERRDGLNQLVDYQEIPYVTRSSVPLSVLTSPVPIAPGQNLQPLLILLNAIKWKADQSEPEHPVFEEEEEAEF